MNCRHCGTPLTHTFVDLGFAPPSNAYLTKLDINKPEKYYPLKVKVCDHCWLVQTEDYANADELFSADYAYFSSTSTGWLEHAKRYVEQITKQLGLNTDSFVIEVASNDGYLLQNFVDKDFRQSPFMRLNTLRKHMSEERLGKDLRWKIFNCFFMYFYVEI